MNQTFYFTYGLSSGMPFRKGWTEVQAKTRREAVALFRLIHPDRYDGIVNCSDIYDEETFKQTSMYKKGNFGVCCHEYISLIHILKGDD